MQSVLVGMTCPCRQFLHAIFSKKMIYTSRNIEKLGLCLCLACGIFSFLSSSHSFPTGRLLIADKMAYKLSLVFRPCVPLQIIKDLAVFGLDPFQ